MSLPLKESHRGHGLYNTNYEASSDVNHATNSFSHLNMDVWETRCAAKPDTDVVIPDNVQRPPNPLSTDSADDESKNSATLLPRDMSPFSHRGHGLNNTNYEASSEGNHVTNTFSHLGLITDICENRCATKPDFDAVRVDGKHLNPSSTDSTGEESENSATLPPRDMPPYSHRGHGLNNTNYEASSDVNHATNSFNHLNMDVCEKRSAAKPDSDVVRMGGTHSMQVVTADNVQRPKFGRKHVAWD